MNIKQGGVRLSLDAFQEYVHRFGAGLVATDGAVYAGTTAYGTVATNIVDALVDPGYTMRVRELQVGLTQKFTGANGSINGSLTYYWQARSEYVDTAAGVGTLKTGSWIPVSGTLQKTVGTNATSEDTLSGFIPVGSLTHLPARFRLVAFAHTYPSGNAKMKNSSFIRAVGEPLR